MTPTEWCWDAPTGPGWIRTRHGHYVNVLEPTPDMIDLDDIAHALAHICRYGGHVPAFYSVAEHSLHVANQLWRTNGNPSLALAGLLHDATEAYVGDMVRPLKLTLGDYTTIETRLARSIEQHFHLTIGALDDPAVTAIDRAIVTWEMAMIRDCTFRIASNPATVTATFIERYHALDALTGTAP